MDTVQLQPSTVAQEPGCELMETLCGGCLHILSDSAPQMLDKPDKVSSDNGLDTV